MKNKITKIFYVYAEELYSHRNINNAAIVTNNCNDYNCKVQLHTLIKSGKNVDWNNYNVYRNECTNGRMVSALTFHSGSARKLHTPVLIAFKLRE